MQISNIILIKDRIKLKGIFMNKKFNLERRISKNFVMLCLHVSVVTAITIFQKTLKLWFKY